MYKWGIIVCERHTNTEKEREKKNLAIFKEGYDHEHREIAFRNSNVISLFFVKPNFGFVYMWIAENWNLLTLNAY